MKRAMISIDNDINIIKTMHYQHKATRTIMYRTAAKTIIEPMAARNIKQPIAARNIKRPTTAKIKMQPTALKTIKHHRTAAETIVHPKATTIEQNKATITIFSKNAIRIHHLTSS